MPALRDVWSACTPSSPTRCITSSEVGGVSRGLNKRWLDLFVIRSAQVIFNRARSRSPAARPEGCAVVVSDAVLRELHLPTDTRVPSLPVPHTPPQPALETPAPRHSAHGAAVQCESPEQPTPDPTHHHCRPRLSSRLGRHRVAR